VSAWFSQDRREANLYGWKDERPGASATFEDKTNSNPTPEKREECIKRLENMAKKLKDIINSETIR